MSLMAFVALSTVVISLVVLAFTKSMMVKAKQREELSTAGYLLGNLVFAGFLILALSAWPSFVMNGLVEASLGVTVAMEGGIITACYLFFHR